MLEKISVGPEIPIGSYLNIEEAIPNITVFIYWDSWWVFIKFYSTYQKKWFMKLMDCYESLGAYERANRPKFQEPNKRRLKRRIK